MLRLSIYACVLCHSLTSLGDVDSSIVRIKWYAPDYMAIQFSGNTGFVSGGIGYMPISQKYSIGFLYGYVPEKFGGTKTHLITVRSTFNLFRIPVRRYAVIPYLGTAASFELGGNSFMIRPSRYPHDYHVQNKLHILLSAGVKFPVYFFKRKTIIKGFEFCCEANTADALLISYLRNRNVHARHIITAGIGANFLLRN